MADTSKPKSSKRAPKIPPPPPFQPDLKLITYIEVDQRPEAKRR